MIKQWVVSVQGGQAVGESTLVRALQHRYPTVYVEFENPYLLVEQRKVLGINTEAGFIANQRLFIEAECQRFQALLKGQVLLDRGLEDIECFTCTILNRLAEPGILRHSLPESLQRCVNVVLIAFSISRQAQPH